MAGFSPGMDSTLFCGFENGDENNMESNQNVAKGVRLKKLQKVARISNPNLEQYCVTVGKVVPQMKIKSCEEKKPSRNGVFVRTSQWSTNVTLHDSQLYN
jgi:hypothetical protein